MRDTPSTASDRSLLHRAVYHRYEPRVLPAKNEPDGDVFAPRHLHIGIAVLVVGYVLAWVSSPIIGAAIMLAGAVIVVDDVIHRALGATTPLDQLWRRILREHIE